MQRSWSPGTVKPLTAQGQVTSQLQFSKYLPDRRQATARLSDATRRESTYFELARSCEQNVSTSHSSYCVGDQPRSLTSSRYRFGWLSAQRMSVARVTPRPGFNTFFRWRLRTIAPWLS